ncbi:hypothetical protein JXB01_03345 [Candidatus Micrarchaeota archaeon]|nr:hypothetical protein [Candidatus Micrarchaeota archaeon]
MVTKKEIEEITDWCEKKKEEKQRVYVVERNPFREKIKWTWRFPLVEIDRPKEVAAKSSLVYDSTTKQLWQFLNGEWRRVEPSIEIRID